MKIPPFFHFSLILNAEKKKRKKKKMELNAAKKGKEKAEKIRCLNREQMKIIAAASMVCDHICMIMLPGNPAAQIVRDTVGRFSFLIFLALFIDGFFYIKLC